MTAIKVGGGGEWGGMDIKQRILALLYNCDLEWFELRSVRSNIKLLLL